MPSVSVPLKTDNVKWAALMKHRRAYWSKGDNNILSPNFRAHEFYCNDGSACPIVSHLAMKKLCEDFLEPLRKKFGMCFVISGYRHTLYNAAIGGARESQHIYEHTFECVASDVRFGRGSPTQWGTEAKLLRLKNNGGEGGVGIYPRSGFIHVDNRGYKADWSG